MLKNEKFEDNLLITTTCLDAGINLRDDEIKTIICDVSDIGVLLQCLGRKRRKENEKFDVYIHNLNNNVFDLEYKTLEITYEHEELEEYLDKIVGKKLFKEEQKELIDKINVRVNGRQQKTYKKLNEGLNMLSLSYIILPKKSNNMRYWTIEKIYK